MSKSKKRPPLKLVDKIPVAAKFGAPGARMDAIEACVEVVIPLLNECPGDALLSALCSIIVTVCANQPDPDGTFQMIGWNVGLALAQLDEMPMGHG